MTDTAVLHTICAAAYLGLVALILIQEQRSRTGVYLSVAAVVTAAWAGSIALGSRVVPVGVIDTLDLLRSLTWYAFVLHLYRCNITADTLLSRTFRTMGLVGLMMLGMMVLLSISAPGAAILAVAEIVARLGIAVCAVLLIENLWLNTEPDRRWHINLACIALGALFIYDIVLSADAVLSRAISAALFAGRPLAATLAVPLLAIGAARNRTWRIEISVSRTAAFHSATLIACGVFFLSIAAAGEVFRTFGADWGAVAEIGLIFTGVLVVGVLVTSGSARSWLRVIVVDHFFSHRYDYRREWIRCINTLSAPDTYVPLHVRAVRAVAEIVDSPGGTLFLRDGADKAFQWAGSWNTQVNTLPIMPDHPIVVLLADHEAKAGGMAQGIVELEKSSAGSALGETLADAWLAVPLRHADQLTGFVLVERPRAEFHLDREVFELLRTVGRMVGSFIAEQRMTEALTQTRHLHEYGKRFTFVAHDIKNVSSQLSLLLANAEVHMQNPEFQRDMLGTVRSSVQKIGTLLRRLQEPEHELAYAVITPAERIAGIVQVGRHAGGVPIAIEEDGLAGRVAMTPAAFDAVITHLLDNAAEASVGGAPVRIRLRHEARRLMIDITDRGVGMTPEFIRDELFRPFGTSKRNGTGIGAFQARELLRQAGGDLLVMSEPGAGTTARLLLPLIGSAEGDVTPRFA